MLLLFEYFIILTIDNQKSGLEMQAKVLMRNILLTLKPSNFMHFKSISGHCIFTCIFTYISTRMFIQLSTFNTPFGYKKAKNKH